MKGLLGRMQEQDTRRDVHRPGPAIAHAYYQSVIDSVAAVICTVDRDLLITSVNAQWEAFARAHGADRLAGDLALGQPFLRFVGAEHTERWKKACKQLLSAELSLYVDEVDRREQVAWRHYSVRASPLADGSGKIAGITFVITNITQLKKAETEMLSRMVQLRGLRQLAYVAGALFDWRAFHKQITADIAHLFGAHQCIIFRWGQRSDHLEVQLPAYGLNWNSQSDLSLDVGAADDPDSLWQDLEEHDYILLNEGGDAPPNVANTFGTVDQLAAMMAVLRVGGRVHGTILVAGRDEPFSEQDGQLLATFAVPIVLAIEDAELRLRLRERGGQLDAARSELDRLANVVQSARRPLTLVRGYLELLLDGTLGSVPEGQLATIRMLLDKSRDLGGVLDQLAPSPLLSDVPQHEPLSLASLLREILDEHSISSRLAGLSLVAHLPTTDSDEYMVSGDRGALSAVFNALVDNSVKFSPNGGAVQVRLYKAGEVVYVRIDDPGIGIPPDLLPRIWDAREQRDGAAAIRLSQVRHIIEEHGGQVWGESTLGHGSTFFVVLPKPASTLRA